MAKPLWWDVTVACDAGFRGVVCARLKQLGLRGCLLEDRHDGRALARAYLPIETTRRLRLVRFSLLLADDAKRLGLGAPEISFSQTDHCRWECTWEPAQVGARLLVQPAAAPIPTEFGRLVIRLLPRFGFGTPGHPTTRHCLEALDRRALERASVADVGCGNGILSIAAARLGAARVQAVDIDPVAAHTARENCALNEVTVEVEAGGIERLRGPVDGILCNLLGPILEQVVPKLEPLAHARSWLIASGVRGRERDSMTALLETHGWAADAWSGEGDWYTTEARRKR